MQKNLYSVLQRHHKIARERVSHHTKAHKWLRDKGLSVGKLREKSRKLLTAGALSGALLLGTGGVNPGHMITEFVGQATAKSLSGQELQNSFVQTVTGILPESPRPLTPEEESKLADTFTRYLKVPALATLDGQHFNTTYGYTGEEQHLARYPGDDISQHDELQNIGIAPGLGAWRYFATSKEALTPEIVMMEKYYIAAQTLYLPDWNTNQPFLKNWYKHRKVLVVNPKNGQAAVAVIGDAGPAQWTGKQFGCSPELMHHLDLDKGRKKGEVVVFFVDDPTGSVPLGPIEYVKITARL